MCVCVCVCVCVHVHVCVGGGGVCMRPHVHVRVYFYIDVWETSIQIIVTLHLISKQACQKGLLINYLVPKNVMQVDC